MLLVSKVEYNRSYYDMKVIIFLFIYAAMSYVYRK